MGNIARLAVLTFASLWVTTALAQNPLGQKPAGGGGNPLAKKPDSPFAGTFSGQGVTLQLNADLSGTLTFEGKNYPVTGSAEGTTYNGKFTADGQQFDLQVVPDGKAMKLTTGGTSYALVQQPQDKPTNPLVLGKGGPAQPIAPPPPAPRNDGPNPAPANVPSGGVGVAFQPNANGELQVAAVMPGSPADKAGIKPGMTLAAVDNKSIEGKSPDQLRAIIGGAAGSYVTLKIVSDKEVTDYVLQRADLSKFALPPGAPAQDPRQAPPPPGPGPMPGPQGDRTMPSPGGPPVGANVAAPAWMKPGARASFWAGSASIASAGQILVPDPEGNWVSKSTGQKFAAADNPGAGGAGYQQFTIANMTGDTVVADFKQYLWNPETRACTIAIASGSVVSMRDGGELWQPPAKLAAMQPGNANGVRIVKGPYPLNGKTYNAVSICTATDSGGTRYCYDLDSGLLLSFGSATTGAGGMTPGPNGQSGWAAGNTMIVQILFVGVRQTNLPWTGQQAPRDLAQVRAVDFAGTYATAVANAGQVTWPLTIHWDVTKVDEISLQLRTTMKVDYGNNGMPQQPAVADRAGGTSLLWVDPRALAQLRPGQVLDEDPVTNIKTTVAGGENGMIAVMEEGATEKSVMAYNQQTGMVQAMSLQTQNGLGTTVIQVQRTR